MLAFYRSNQPELLKRRLVKTPGTRLIQTRRQQLTRLAVVFSIVAVVWLLAQPMVSTIGQGELSYELAIPKNGRGGVELNLGPAGVVKFYTHKTPVEIKMNLVISEDPTNGQTHEDLIRSIMKQFEPDANREFRQFLATRIILLIVLGMLIGASLGNGNRNWARWMWRNAFDYGVLVIVATAIFSQVTYSTLDRSPRVTYTGYAAKYVPVILDIIRQPSGGFKIAAGSLDRSIGGMHTASRQARNERPVYPEDSLTRVLAISDVHDNFYGIGLAESILNDGFGQFSAVLMTGDITDFGQAFEASLFRGFASRMREAGIPVFYVNGNHETARATDQFEKLGFVSLDSQVTTIDGLELVGADDPQASGDYMASDDALLVNDSDMLATMWSAFGSEAPQVLAVHELAQAEAVIQIAKQSQQDLTVVFGHDHQTSVKTEGSVNLVGCGTAGASGFRDVGKDPSRQYSYQILEFRQGSEPTLVAVTTLEYKGLNQGFTFTYTPVPVN